MKIKLEYPYNTLWERGYVYVNSGGRRTLSLVNSSKDRTSTSYARYLMSVSLGRFLEETEHVDHINEDKTDDRLENLQILPQIENNRKHVINSGKSAKRCNIICSGCGDPFEIRLKVLEFKLEKGQGSFYCSKLCLKAHLHPPLRNEVSVELKDKIKQLRSQGKSSYYIANALSIARNTVMKYW